MKRIERRALSPVLIALTIVFGSFSLILSHSFAEEGLDITRYFESSQFTMSDEKTFGIELMLPDKRLKEGENTIELAIHDRAGNDVEGAAISVSYGVPADEYSGEARPVITERGGGFYTVENIIVTKGGDWEVSIAIKTDISEDTATFPFSSVEISVDEEVSPTDSTDEDIKPESLETVSPGHTTGVAESTEPEKSQPAPPAMNYDIYKSVLTPLPPIPPIPPDNPMTAEKIKLGKMLYWDRRVSKTGSTSCAFCHHPTYYGAEPMRKSVGIKGEVHLRNAQTVLNAAFLNAFFWAAESPTLEHQALRTIQSQVTMRSLPSDVAERLNRIPEYSEMSMKVFGSPLTGEYISKALSAYMRTLITTNYPLARWLSGDAQALTEQQRKGMALFVDRGCIGCHHGPYFSGAAHNKTLKVKSEEHSEGRTMGLHLHKVIVPGAEDDHGLSRRTKKEEDKYFFKVPSLLNVARTSPYTHAGLIDKLEDMVSFMAENMLGVELSQEEGADIAAFLHSLTGEMPRDFMIVPTLPLGRGEGDFGPEFLPSGKD